MAAHIYVYQSSGYSVDEFCTKIYGIWLELMSDKQDNFPFTCLFQQGTSMNLSVKKKVKKHT